MYRESWPQGQHTTDSTPIAAVYVKPTPKNSRRARPRTHRADSSPAAGPVCRETCPRWSIERDATRPDRIENRAL